MNDLNRKFWEEQQALTERGLEDPTVRKAVMWELQKYRLRGTPAAHQDSIESIVGRVVAAGKAALSEQARRAGSAKKTDALQKLIVSLVRKHPRMNAPELLARLEEEPRSAVIDDIDGEMIYFTEPSGRSKEAPISGLKDRLSRAKKIPIALTQSREPPLLRSRSGSVGA